MKISQLQNAGQLENTEPFYVRNLLWGTESIPETFGRLGFIPGDGFYLNMVCMESDPLRTYTEDQSPVCMDSAMEAFFCFTGGDGSGETPVYLNFVMNAHGALLAEYGRNRRERTPFSTDEMKMLSHRAQIGPDRWSIFLRIPPAVLENIYGPLHFEGGSRFTCNFYKISETREHEHYASWSPVRTEHPDFHRPEYFGPAEIDLKLPCP